MKFTRPATSRERETDVHPGDVGLRHVSDARAGYLSAAMGRHFRYFDASGMAITDAEMLARIRAISVPPAWTHVWICPFSNSYLQATGRDARERKQYRYHRQWRAVRDESKFARLVAFGAALRRIRAR